MYFFLLLLIYALSVSCLGLYGDITVQCMSHTNQEEYEAYIHGDIDVLSSCNRLKLADLNNITAAIDGVMPSSR